MLAYPVDHYGSDNSEFNFQSNMNTFPANNIQPIAPLSLGIAQLNIQNGHVSSVKPQKKLKSKSAKKVSSITSKEAKFSKTSIISSKKT